MTPVNDSRTDNEIVASVLDGNVNDFEAIVLRYQKKVYSTVLRLCGDRSSAEDLSQEVFLKLFRGLDRFRGDSSFSTYLYRVALNTSIDALRKKGSAPPELSIHQESDDGDSYDLELPDRAPLPLEQMERRELSEALWLAIDALPHNHRQILVLREMDELSYAEIGDLLQLNEGTVKSRINRARALLRSKMEQRAIDGR